MGLIYHLQSQQQTKYYARMLLHLIQININFKKDDWLNFNMTCCTNFTVYVSMRW